MTTEPRVNASTEEELRNLHLRLQAVVAELERDEATVPAKLASIASHYLGETIYIIRQDR